MIPRGVCNAAFLLGISVISASVGASAQERKEPGPAASEQQAFNNACRTCHMVKEGDNRLGPNLHQIIGRKAGSLPDYNYSSAMKEAGFAWDKEKLERFIANPDEVVPGNNMKPYGGLVSSDDRTKILAFLAQSQ
jgi:cytochrome c